MSGIKIGYDQTNMPKIQSQAILSQFRKYKVNDVLLDIVTPDQYNINFVDNAQVKVALYSVSITGILTLKEQFTTSVTKASRYIVQLGYGGNYSFALGHNFANTPESARLQITVTKLL